LAHRPFDATETLHLLERQPETGHFHELGAETGQHVVHRSHEVPRDVTDGDNGATEFAFCLQPVMHIVPVFAATCEEQIERATGDVLGRWC